MSSLVLFWIFNWVLAWFNSFIIDFSAWNNFIRSSVECAWCFSKLFFFGKEKQKYNLDFILKSLIWIYSIFYDASVVLTISSSVYLPFPKSKLYIGWSTLAVTWMKLIIQKQQL